MGCGASSGQSYAETTEAEAEVEATRDFKKTWADPEATGGSRSTAPEPRSEPCSSSFGQAPHRTTAPFSTHGKDPGIDSKDASKEPGCWYFESSPGGNWVPFKEQISANLEMTQSLGRSHMVYVFQGETHDVDLDRKIVTNWFTGHFHRIEYRRGGAASKPGVATSHAKRAKPEPEGRHASYRAGEWQWQQNEEIWLSFDDDTKLLLRAARLMGKETVCYVANGSEYEANLETCVQKNLQSGYERKLRWVRPKKESVQFQWQLKNGSWVDYEEEENEKICTAYATKERFFRWSARGNDYQLDFAKLIQENVSTNSGMSRNVRLRPQGSSEERSKPEERAKPSVCKAPGGPSSTPGVKRFSFHSGAESHGSADEPHTGSTIPPGHPPLDPKHAFGPSASGPSERKPSHGTSTGEHHSFGHADSGRSASGHPPFAKAFSAFRTGGDRASSTQPEEPSRGPSEQRKSSPYSGHGSSSEKYDLRAPSARSGSPPPAGGGPRTKSSPRAPGGSSHPRASSDTGTGSREKNASGYKLPSFVDWPDDAKSRKAAQDVFNDLCKVPINERKKTFMKACLRWHPDKNLDDEDTATDVFQFLQSLKEWYLGE